MVEHPLLCDHHPLRFAGRARGIDHIGQALIIRIIGQQQRTLLREVLPGGIQTQRLDRTDRELITQVGIGQQDPWLRVLENGFQATFRCGQIQRQIGSTGLEDRQHADHHLDGARHIQSNQHVRTNTQAAQAMRELCGPFLQLSIGQSRLATDQGDRGGIAVGVVGDQLVQ
ncbi:hypothetical protein KDW_58430 [Dictyobacter vulcani]|uniref:Uncharacterized protein n=1 Tax=Dictyobacter vulcani TaxID=2607529 RepID=A0A5J4KYW0_9CHLR|nr:hypothetical protein KDW_58430 [Dictyobacter vulcani]